MPISVLKMPVSDPDGSTHPDAIWIPAQVVMDNIGRQGGVDWYAYHDSNAFLTGKQPIAGVQHHTTLDTALYAQVQTFPVTAGTYGGATATALAYLALHVIDPPAPGIMPAPDAPAAVPFFAAAQVVQIGD